MRLVLDQHAYLDFDSGSLLKQQSAGRSVIPLGLFLILSQPVLALTAYYLLKSEYFFQQHWESEYFFQQHWESEYFFQQHWESEYFFRKKP